MSRLAKILLILAGFSLMSFFVARLLISFWVPFLWLPLGLTVIFVLCALYVERALAKDFLSLKTTKHGMNMGLMILLVLVGVVIVNYIGVRRQASFDFSESQVNSLSDQSVKVMQSLEGELLVRFFYQEGVQGVDELKRQFRNLIQKYQDQSPNIRLEFIELNSRPDLAEEYQVREGKGVVFVDYKGRRAQIEVIAEQEITNALLNVTKESEKTIYFISGHGELDSHESDDAQGAGALRNMLAGGRYEVKELALATAPKIPEDADVLAIIGPSQSFLDSEIQAITKYLRGGGNLFLALEPKGSGSLGPLLQQLGVDPGNNYLVTLVKTPFGDTINPAATPASQFSPTHPITKPFKGEQFVIFRLPQSISWVGEAREDIKREVLVSTGANSFAFESTDFAGESSKGPFDVGFAMEGKLTEAEEDFRAVVFGDADFLGNQLLYQNLNRDLAINSFSYLAREENLISITPKEVKATELELTENRLMGVVLGVFIPMPLIFFTMALVLWFRRRHA